MKEEQYLQMMRAIDKYDRLGASGVHQLLTKGRLDDSGAWTAGCGLSDTQADLILCFLRQKGATNKETIHKMRRFFTLLSMSEHELTELHAGLDKLLDGR